YELSVFNHGGHLLSIRYFQTTRHTIVSYIFISDFAEPQETVRIPVVMVSLNLRNGNMIVRDLLFYQVANEIGADCFASRGIYAEIENVEAGKLPWLLWDEI